MKLIIAAIMEIIFIGFVLSRFIITKKETERKIDEFVKEVGYKNYKSFKFKNMKLLKQQIKKELYLKNKEKFNEENEEEV